MDTLADPTGEHRSENWNSNNNVLVILTHRLRMQAYMKLHKRGYLGALQPQM